MKKWNLNLYPLALAAGLVASPALALGSHVRPNQHRVAFPTRHIQRVSVARSNPKPTPAAKYTYEITRTDEARQPDPEPSHPLPGTINQSLEISCSGGGRLSDSRGMKDSDGKRLSEYKNVCRPGGKLELTFNVPQNCERLVNTELHTQEDRALLSLRIPSNLNGCEASPIIQTKRTVDLSDLDLEKGAKLKIQLVQGRSRAQLGEDNPDLEAYIISESEIMEQFRDKFACREGGAFSLEKFALGMKELASSFDKIRPESAQALAEELSEALRSFVSKDRSADQMDIVKIEKALLKIRELLKDKKYSPLHDTLRSTAQSSLAELEKFALDNATKITAEKLSQVIELVERFGQGDASKATALRVRRAEMAVAGGDVSAFDITADLKIVAPLWAKQAQRVCQTQGASQQACGEAMARMEWLNAQGVNAWATTNNGGNLWANFGINGNRQAYVQPWGNMNPALQFQMQLGSQQLPAAQQSMMMNPAWQYQMQIAAQQQQSLVAQAYYANIARQNAAAIQWRQAAAIQSQQQQMALYQAQMYRGNPYYYNTGCWGGPTSWGGYWNPYLYFSPGMGNYSNGMMVPSMWMNPYLYSPGISWNGGMNSPIMINTSASADGSSGASRTTGNGGLIGSIIGGAAGGGLGAGIGYAIGGNALGSVLGGVLGGGLGAGLGFGLGNELDR